MRQGAVLAGRHDRVKGRPVRPQLAECLLEQERDIPLPESWSDARAYPIESPAGDAGHLSQELHLMRRLEQAQFLDEPGGRHQLHLRGMSCSQPPVPRKYST